MSEVEIARQDSADDVAEALAQRLLGAIHDLQAEQRVVQLCLTGGRIAAKAYQRLAVDGANAPVDWSRVELWWGDERWVAADSEDRNDRQALDILSALPLDQARIHPMPADDGDQDLDAAAAAYAGELGGTTFDLCLLGMGPDGHVASLFPDHDFTAAPAPAIGVRNSPKPPPERISLTLPLINASTEVWLCVTGAEKAESAGRAIDGDEALPAGHVHGTARTVWLIDADAAPRA